MSLFSNKNSSERVGAIIDIGSGSVLVAIVVSHSGKKKPTVVWSHREQAPLRTIESLDQSAKSVMTSLVNALLQFDSKGRQALHDYSKHARIEEVQCCICAPWAYTVTKNITYNQNESFEITKALIESLIESAEKSTQAELAENEAATELGLTIITRSTLDTLANGYRVAIGTEGKATELQISQVSVVTQQYLVDHLTDLKHKIFSDKPLHKLSYMLALYSVTDELFHDSGDFCLVDVTYEATEIGIVRDGTLTYSTHIPFGSFSLARELAHSTSLPLLQSFQSLHDGYPLPCMSTLSESQQKDIDAALEAYMIRLKDLFAETGDDLSIPKRIYVHTENELEPLYEHLITRAVTAVLKTAPTIKPLSSLLTGMVEVIHPEQNTDTAMLVAAKFFHTQNVRRNFEYL